MSYTRRISRFMSSRCGKLLTRLVLPLYVVQCVLLFSGDVIRNTSSSTDNTLELQFLSFRPEINLLSLPASFPLNVEKIAPLPVKPKDPSVIKVAIGLAITSKSLSAITPENITGQYVFFRDFLPSFCATRSTDKKYAYSVYVGYDFVDWYLKEDANLEIFTAAFGRVTEEHCQSKITLKMVTCQYTAKPAWSQNDAMMEAYIDGHDYYYRINDDIILTSRNWTSLFIERLNQYEPANVGVVAPLHSGGNQKHMEFDFVHRTHVDIFGWYYPRVFLDLYGDIWMGWVYAPGRAEKLKNVNLNHTQKAGKRYNEAKKGGGAGRRFRLRPELARSRALLKRYLNVTSGKFPSRPKDPRKVIAMSLPNEMPEYVYSLIRYANIARMILPDWTIRAYTGKHFLLPDRITRILFSLGVEIFTIDSEEFTSSVPHELWKYLVLNDEQVDTFFIRRTQGSMFEFECALLDSWLSTQSSSNRIQCIPDFELGNDNNALTVTPCSWVGVLDPYRNDALLQNLPQNILNYANRVSHTHADTSAGRIIEAYFSAAILGAISEKYSANSTDSSQMVKFKNVTNLEADFVYK